MSLLPALVVGLAVTGLALGGGWLWNRRQLKRRLHRRDEALHRLQLELASNDRELALKSSELERFIYTVSHDLKNPLITIRGFLGMLQQDLESGRGERVASDLEHIHTAAGTMARLLDELLELARAGRVIHTLHEVDLAEVAREAVGQVAGRIRQRGIDVVIASDLPVVMGDRQRLLQVLENLVDNAVKFMGDTPRPRIAIGWRQRAGERVFYVRDNGTGIDPRYHVKVFGLFNRLDESGDGTGLGLALVQRVIEEHGGRIWVESEGRGRGATFYFTLG